MYSIIAIQRKNQEKPHLRQKIKNQLLISNVTTPPTVCSRRAISIKSRKENYMFIHKKTNTQEFKSGKKKQQQKRIDYSSRDNYHGK